MQSNSIKLEVVGLVQNGEKYKAIYEKKAGEESACKTYMQNVDAIAAQMTLQQ
jgi:hypothetical protein